MFVDFQGKVFNCGPLWSLLSAVSKLPISQVSIKCWLGTSLLQPALQPQAAVILTLIFATNAAIYILSGHGPLYRDLNQVYPYGDSKTADSQPVTSPNQAKEGNSPMLYCLRYFCWGSGSSRISASQSVVCFWSFPRILKWVILKILSSIIINIWKKTFLSSLLWHSGCLAPCRRFAVL